MKKNNWKDLKQTLKTSKKKHEALIKATKDKEGDFHHIVGEFINECGERYIIINYAGAGLFMIAGDETNWTPLTLLKDNGTYVGVSNTFTFNEQELKAIKKLID